MSTAIVYWSGTGNTQAMAEAIAKGIENVGESVDVFEVSSVDANTIASYDCIAMGCPATGGEQLEEEEMEPFVESIESLLEGKRLLLFGSYGWGDGEWMRDWVERMNNAGAKLSKEDGLIANESPSEEDIEACMLAGRELVQKN